MLRYNQNSYFKLKITTMEEILHIEHGKDYLTNDGSTVTIEQWTGSHWIGFLHLVPDYKQDWKRNGESTESNLALDLKCLKKDIEQMPEIQIEIRDQKAYDDWKYKLCENPESKDLKLWLYTHQWIYIMEQELKYGTYVEEIAQQSAEKIQLLESPRHPKGEVAITIAYQCWKLGEELASIDGYKAYCIAV